MRDKTFVARAALWVIFAILAAALTACGDSGKKAGNGTAEKAPKSEGVHVMQASQGRVPASQLLPPIKKKPSTTETPHGRLTQMVRPASYHLDLRILPDEDTFSGHVQIALVLDEAVDGIWLHGNGLDVKTATAVLPGGREVAATYKQVDPTGVARLTFDETLPKGKAVLHVDYEAPFNERLAGLYRVKEGGRYYAATQFEPIDARRAFPGFDEPAFKVPFDVSITAPKKNVVITNTPQTDKEDLGDGLVKHTFATTKPLPTYLVAFAVGPYDVVSAADIPPLAGVRDRPVPLRGVAAKGKGRKLRYALAHAGEILSTLEGYFGVEYPYKKLDLIAAPQFAFGAMENAGAIVYAERLLLLNKDAPLNQRRAYALVNAHEMSHQWFGDLVTPEWWSDIWLNEAFATWMGNKAANLWNPQGNFGRETLRDALQTAMPADSLASARQIRQPVRRNQDVINSFDSITYQKGGAVLAMFESYLGKDAFRKGVQLHLKRYAFHVANTDQFMESLADGSGNPDVVPAFSSFIDQPGVPLVSAKADCTGDGPAKVILTQGPYRPIGSAIPLDRRWTIPACVRAIGANGTERACTLIDGDQTTVELKNGCPRAVMPNADGAGYYRWTLDNEGWHELMANFSRLNAKEALSFADSLTAALDAGKIDASEFFEGLGLVATHPAWDVATMPIDRLVHWGNTILDADHRLKLHEFVAQLYKPRLDAIGLMPRKGEDDAVRLMRVPLVSYLALHARLPELRKKLSVMGQDYVGFKHGGKIVAGAAPPDLRPIALMVAAQELGRPFTKYLTKKLARSGDAELRTSITLALANVDDPALAADIRALTLGDTMRLREILNIITRQMTVPEIRNDAWEWYRTNFDAVMDKLPPWRRNRAPALARNFCSDERLHEVKDFFTEKADELSGAELAYKQTVETIGLCIALKETKGAEIAQWLDGRG